METRLVDGILSDRGAYPSLSRALLNLPEPIFDLSRSRPGVLLLTEAASLNELEKACTELKTEQLALGFAANPTGAANMAEFFKLNKKIIGPLQKEAIEFRHNQLAGQLDPQAAREELIRVCKISYVALNKLFHLQRASGQHDDADHVTGALMDRAAYILDGASSEIQFLSDSSFIYCYPQRGNLPSGWHWLPVGSVILNPSIRQKYHPCFKELLDNRQIIDEAIARAVFRLRSDFLEDCEKEPITRSGTADAGPPAK